MYETVPYRQYSQPEKGKSSALQLALSYCDHLNMMLVSTACFCSGVVRMITKLPLNGAALVPIVLYPSSRNGHT